MRKRNGYENRNYTRTPAALESLGTAGSFEVPGNIIGQSFVTCLQLHPLLAYFAIEEEES
jgi:hypothetical protein